MSHSPRRVKIRHIVLALVIAIAAFLLLVPTKVQPADWAPFAAPSLSTGVYAENQKLKGVEPVGTVDIRA
jgi:hypothetical protein